MLQCRRCNFPIEKQAVSSSDGQLKGKYHKDCFNCHTCHVRSCLLSSLHTYIFNILFFFLIRNHSLTKHSTSTTANLSAPTTTTNLTIHSVHFLYVDNLSKVLVLFL